MSIVRVIIIWAEILAGTTSKLATTFHLLIRTESKFCQLVTVAVFIVTSIGNSWFQSWT